MKILIDNGHGSDTKGKCSPDGRLLEWRYNREITRRVYESLKNSGQDVTLVTPESNDISLSQRVRRVNEWCDRLGSSRCVLVSIHVNAAGNGDWYSARGWTGWVAPDASAASRQLARIFYSNAMKLNLKGNRSTPPGNFWTGKFMILTNTKCPAILTENLFQDNKEDVEYLLSEEGMETISRLHILSINQYISEKIHCVKN